MTMSARERTIILSLSLSHACSFVPFVLYINVFIFYDWNMHTIHISSSSLCACVFFFSFQYARTFFFKQ